MAGPLEELMIKAGLPSVAEATRRLAFEITEGRRRGVQLLRVVHGYGSSGVGGKLRVALRRWLEAEQSQGRLGRVVPGEHWEIFDETSLGLLEDYPFLREDDDLNQGNAGVTLVELRRRRK